MPPRECGARRPRCTSSSSSRARATARPGARPSARRGCRSPPRPEERCPSTSERGMGQHAGGGAGPGDLRGRGGATLARPAHRPDRRCDRAVRALLLVDPPRKANASPSTLASARVSDLRLRLPARSVASGPSSARHSRPRWKPPLRLASAGAIPIVNGRQVGEPLRGLGGRVRFLAPTSVSRPDVMAPRTAPLRPSPSHRGSRLWGPSEALAVGS
jgi:hypothetical protein